ncbi:MAG: hypothetical protein OXF84_04055 [Bacteroidetes bacterium]|nr:hypothetical protein [Bacteroidota bacterium]
MKLFFVLALILLLSSCGGNQQEITDGTTDSIAPYVVSDSLREEREMMMQRIDFCEEIFGRIIYKQSFRACITGYLAQPIPR